MRIGKPWFILTVAAACVLLDAQTLFAWGPVTHVKLAGNLLSNLSLLPAAVAVIISRHVQDYLYGALATDMVFAKRLSRIKQFCHHWSTGFRLLDEADDDRGRAFAYGYLSHLAADTVAHGKFVPYQIVTTGTTVHFGHVYWEARADAEAGERACAALEAIMPLDHQLHHVALARVLTETFLPYQVNRVLFERIHSVVAKRRWRSSIETWSRWSRRPLPAELLTCYLDECTDRTICVLRWGPGSPLLCEDPCGSAALAFAADTRRSWRRRRRRGLLLRHRLLEAAAGHTPSRWPTQACTLGSGQR
ncbi:MAG: zinc dependent phospholipase C family protein [Phycisphaerae bacterium]|nr:zinc dependent phospholipase C family protein [Phycisphaerae bacterium]